MEKKKGFLLLTIITGFLCYFYGFLFYSKINAIIMLIGGLLVSIPVLLIGIEVRKKMLSFIIIAMSIFFILVITFFLVTTLVMF